jgi:transcription-repair coupling factor (superfamily II helicase)
MATLAALSRPAQSGRPSVVLTAVNAAVQRVPAVAEVAGDALVIEAGERVGMDRILAWVDSHGFVRSSTVREPGEYAVRGGIVDLFPAGATDPVRLDFFGETLESIRRFDAESQRTTGRETRLELVPTNELVLDADSIARFRQSYVTLFGAADRNDILYQAISEGRRAPGMEHWLPLFAEHLGTLFDYLPGVPWVLDHLARDAVGERINQIKDHYAARLAARDAGESQVPYQPAPPDQLYLGLAEWQGLLAERPAIQLSPFVAADAAAIDVGGRQGRRFGAE